SCRRPCRVSRWFHCSPPGAGLRDGRGLLNARSSMCPADRPFTRSGSPDVANQGRLCMSERQTFHRGLWILFALVVICSFAVLGGLGFRIASMAPPIPVKVCTPDGKVLFDGESIQ